MTMEQSNSLLLNETALKQCPDPAKPIFIFEWLRYLDRILPADLKNSQQQLIEQLSQRIATGPGPPTRLLLAKCIAQVYLISDSFDLFETIRQCHEVLKEKDDSNAQMQIKLTALAVLGEMYETLGRRAENWFNDSYKLMTKWLKSAESSSRAEILLTLSKMIRGLNSPSFLVHHKDLYKTIRFYLTERVMAVRVAAVKAFHSLISDFNSPIYLGDVESVFTFALKSIDGSNNEVRFEVAKVFAKFASYAVNHKPAKSLVQSSEQNQPTKTTTLETVLGFMSDGFLRGGIGSIFSSSNSPNAVAGGHREIRVGLALAYVEVARELGTKWLERNLLHWQKHLLDVAKRLGPLASAEHFAQTAEAVHMRRCISYIFRQTLGLMLSENSQINACRNFGQLVSEYSVDLEVAQNEEVDRTQTAAGGPIAIACTVSLLEIAALVRQVDSSITPLFVEACGIMEPVFACVVHPFPACRLAAAWCLRCVIRAVPTQAAPLIDRCLNRLGHLRKSPVMISGISTALAALTTGSLQTELGIPFQKTKQVFNIADELIRTATQSSRLTLSKIQAGWMLITSVISMGAPYIRQNMSRLQMLWRVSFPRSVDEATRENERGDAFTWRCVIETRAGAFASMEALVLHCPELLTRDLFQRSIVLPAETTLQTLAVIHKTKNSSFNHQILRIRLYALLSRLPTDLYAHFFNALIRELVADITLADDKHSTTTSSQLASQCSAVGDCLLGGWLVNQSELELQMHPSQYSECGAIEYDPLCVVIGGTSWAVAQAAHDSNDPRWPEPFPVQTASVNAAIQMFGRIYPLVPTRHKIQLTEHFFKSLADIRSPARLQVVQLNILGAMLSAMKSQATVVQLNRDQKPRIDNSDLQNLTVRLIRPFLTAERPLLKCLAVEALGRLAQAVADPQFVAANAQLIFDELQPVRDDKSARLQQRDEKSRSGLGLALGTLHRYAGSLGSDKHLHNAIGNVLTLAQDNSSATVQAWAILSLSLIASTGGGMFHGYVEPSLNLCLRQLLNTPSANSEVVWCIGKLVSALITAVGPELAVSTPVSSTTTMDAETTRQSFTVACAMMFNHPDPQVKAESIACQQQLHLFAPRFVQLDLLVADICHQLYSSHFVLRKAAVNCLKQLLQREAKEVREHAQKLAPVGIFDRSMLRERPLPETGLEGALFELLDLETDVELRQNINECLLFLVQATSDEMLNVWLSMCKDILASSTNVNVRSTLVISDSGSSSQKTSDQNVTVGNSITSTMKEDEDDEDALQSIQLGESKSRDKVAPRWPTRVFAFAIVRKLMTVCETERAHLDLALAKELQMSSNGRTDYLVLHLADLVRMSFMGATSDNSSLRLAGLSCLQDVIDRFAAVPEPEIPEHVVLEQFQAQVSAALGPAFEPETPSHVTAAACQVCSAWICSGVARNLNDLRRVHQLLVSSLEKLKLGSLNAQLYNESAATLEKLSILKAWAEVYAEAVRQQELANNPTNDELTSRSGNTAPTTPARLLSRADSTAYNFNLPNTFTSASLSGSISTSSTSLLNLVNPELGSLVGHWMSALRDSALLSLPPKYADQLPPNGGAFYTLDSAESCKEYYRNSWPPILLASSIWLKNHEFGIASGVMHDENEATEPNDEQPFMLQWNEEERIAQLHLMLGMCVESLWLNATGANRQSHDSADRTIHLCLETLTNLLHCPWAQMQLMSDIRLPIEIMNVLYRLILTSNSLQVQYHSTDVVQSILDAACVALKTVADEDVENGNIPSGLKETTRTGGFDGFDPENGKIHLPNSLAFATLEVCLCVLVRQIPQVNPAPAPSGAPRRRHCGRLSQLSNDLIRRGITILSRVTDLCTSRGSTLILPSALFLILSVLRESSRLKESEAVVGNSSEEKILSAQTDHSHRGHITEPAQAAIKAIRSIIATPLPEDETFESRASIIRSALLSLLKMTEDEDSQIDEAVVMVTVCVLLTNIPRKVAIGFMLFHKTCDLMRKCLKSNNYDVEFKALQSVNSLFAPRTPNSSAFVRELGSSVFAKLRPYITPPHDSPQITETDLPMLTLLSDQQFLVIQETIRAVESVLSISRGDKEVVFVNLLVRCLVRFLCPNPETQLANAPENVRRLHDFALSRLNSIRLSHPEPFTRLFNDCAPVRQRIQDAARVIAKQQQQEEQNAILTQQKALAARQAAIQAAQQKPAIQLRDFSAAKV
ncbi:HEAT repeat-containing protein 5B [Aphelenchoides besseyi]|nr:HEAT repeat-containing protein 5B [Aphelenchoides besseyi]KAI6202074.1 HEAT repeat-containing protein 5B [Aphelenchoides besseyi]